jgi:hypothetical protein
MQRGNSSAREGATRACTCVRMTKVIGTSGYRPMCRAISRGRPGRTCHSRPSCGTVTRRTQERTTLAAELTRRGTHVIYSAGIVSARRDQDTALPVSGLRSRLVSLPGQWRLRQCPRQTLAPRRETTGTDLQSYCDIMSGSVRATFSRDVHTATMTIYDIILETNMYAT